MKETLPALFQRMLGSVREIARNRPRMPEKCHSQINSRFRWNVFLCGISLFFVVILPAFSQSSSPKLYVTVLETTGYVVGKHNAPSGLHRFERDTVWTHLGWRNTRGNGVSGFFDTETVLFLASGNGIMRSEDSGNTWRITTGWDVTEIQDIAVDPQMPAHVYAATAYGVWASDNQGESWRAINEGLNPAFTQAVEVDFSQSGLILVGGEGGLFRSTNRGQRWNHVGPFNVAIRDVQQSAVLPILWLAGTEDHGVLISTDRGEHWQAVEGALADETIYAVALDPTDIRRMAAAGYRTGVFVSNDGGMTFSQRTAGLPVTSFHALVYDPEKPGKLWAGTVGEGVFFSDDEGEHWTYAGLHGATINDLVFLETRD